MKYSLQWDPVRDQIHHYCELTSYQCETTLWIQCLLANVLCVFMCRDPLHLTLMMNYIYCHYQLFLSNISTINFLLHLISVFTPVSKYEEFQNKLLMCLKYQCLIPEQTIVCAWNIGVYVLSYVIYPSFSEVAFLSCCI